jgi:hypothetical protein
MCYDKSITIIIIDNNSSNKNNNNEISVIKVILETIINSIKIYIIVTVIIIMI